MTGLGLFLGGGGAVGIAWESGVLAGLVDTCRFDPGACTVVIGTSAGAAVGARVASGGDPHRVLDRDHEIRLPPLDPPDLESGPFAEILQLMMSGEARTPAGAARMGELAVQAETPVTEEAFVEAFRAMLGTDEWPTSVDFRATTTSCSTGEPRVWSADDGIDLARAVASSCAIPGFFPTVAFEGERYMDAIRGADYHTKIVAGLDLDAALFVGPRIALAPAVDDMIRHDMDALAATGVRTLTILGSERLDAAGLNLMDTSKRALGFEIGVGDGEAHAASVADLLA